MSPCGRCKKTKILTKGRRAGRRGPKAKGGARGAKGRGGGGRAKRARAGGAKGGRCGGTKRRARGGACTAARPGPGGAGRGAITALAEEALRCSAVIAPSHCSCCRCCDECSARCWAAGGSGACPGPGNSMGRASSSQFEKDSKGSLQHPPNGEGAAAPKPGLELAAPKAGVLAAPNPAGSQCNACPGDKRSSLLAARRREPLVGAAGVAVAATGRPSYSSHTGASQRARQGQEQGETVTHQRPAGWPRWRQSQTSRSPAGSAAGRGRAGKGQAGQQVRARHLSSACSMQALLRHALDTNPLNTNFSQRVPPSTALHAPVHAVCPEQPPCALPFPSPAQHAVCQHTPALCPSTHLPKHSSGSGGAKRRGAAAKGRSRRRGGRAKYGGGGPRRGARVALAAVLGDGGSTRGGARGASQAGIQQSQAASQLARPRHLSAEAGAACGVVPSRQEPGHKRAQQRTPARAGMRSGLANPTQCALIRHCCPTSRSSRSTLARRSPALAWYPSRRSSATPLS